MNRRIRTVCVVGALGALATAAAGCGRAASSSSPSTDGGEAGAKLPAAVAPTAQPARTGRPGSEAGAARQWSGTYHATAAALYVPEEWKVRWRAEDTTSGLGEGALSFSVDPVSGALHGAIEGPLGPGILDGYAADGKATARIARRDPNDHGFSGILAGKMTGDRIDGTLQASPSTAGAVRAGTFSASPSPGGETP